MSDRSSALEMTSVNWVIADNSSIQTDIGFGERITDEIVLALEKIIESTERLVEWVIVGFVCFLSRSKAAGEQTVSCALARSEVEGNVAHHL